MFQDCLIHVFRGQLLPRYLSFQQKYQRIEQTLALVFAAEGSFGVITKPQRAANSSADILRGMFAIFDIKRTQLEIP